ncbi:putative 5-methyltetrahydropteroyltriglutamate-homocysteine methyltransferase protein [Phaeoacremonium minimum UCRPA7]|uniref:Putative 5-methyltetrahydropteroyltriglutamate-homocysteine methyltransferase protein n=1 Tax=Phaeoacremonium minimum (strain UCR-PA7) TaxID=1286976 RepID=R8B9L6_PHAM7|nr:putative 5-methyltetrahydropteroyltriglutamate-homocysteine methyltransferase protein [Phaeoacremonium minimum UCRPA7]EON95988.1 putative 5-methyltetrahydropteroyltriglutamate-homocysteine methyltransferase protein [Phaeoacremonium minimum UCRPA7]
MAPPFKAEHLGSLLRPQKLLDVREAIREKGVAPEDAGLDAAEKEAVSAVIQMQRDLGLKAVTDGEYTRTRFWGLFWDEIEGTTALQEASADMFRLYHPDVVSLIEKDRHVMPGDSVIAGGKLSHNPEKSKSNLHELQLAQQFVPKEEWGNIKMTMITPAWFHMRYKQGKAYTPEAYANDAEYFKDVAKVYQAELDLLYKNGLRNVQFDDPGLAYFCSQKFRQGWADDKDNIGTVDELLDAYIALYNDSISKLPADFHTGVHLCRGNFIGGRFFAEGAYDIIAQKLFQNLDVNTFYLEYDTERAGGFEPLKYLPKNKNVVVGVISTKLRQLEDKEEMKARIYKAAEFVAEGSGQTKEEALKRISVSPQCGFSTHESGYPLSEDDEKKKLSLVRQIADEIWGEP